MGNYGKMLIIVRETRESLRKNEISQEDAIRILTDLDNEYKSQCYNDVVCSIKIMLREIIEKDDPKDLNFLI